MKKVYTVSYHYLHENYTFRYVGNCKTIPSDIMAAFWNFVRSSDMKKSEVVVDSYGTGLL